MRRITVIRLFEQSVGKSQGSKAIPFPKWNVNWNIQGGGLNVRRGGIFKRNSIPLVPSLPCPEVGIVREGGCKLRGLGRMDQPFALDPPQKKKKMGISRAMSGDNIDGKIDRINPESIVRMPIQSLNFSNYADFGRVKLCNGFRCSPSGQFSSKIVDVTVCRVSRPGDG